MEAPTLNPVSAAAFSTYVHTQTHTSMFIDCIHVSVLIHTSKEYTVYKHIRLGLNNHIMLLIPEGLEAWGRNLFGMLVV